MLVNATLSASQPERTMMLKPANIIFDLGGVIFDYDRTVLNPDFYLLAPGLDVLKKCAAQTDQLGNKLHKLYILSNWGKSGFNKIKSQYPDIIALFDGYVISGEIGHAKPSTQIFKVLIDRYQLEDEYCIFIDDSEINTHVAKQFGWHSFLHDGTNNIESLLASLDVF